MAFSMNVSIGAQSWQKQTRRKENKKLTMVPRKATDSLTIHMFKELFLKRRDK
jgi:hypothetical protein